MEQDNRRMTWSTLDRIISNEDNFKDYLQQQNISYNEIISIAKKVISTDPELSLKYGGQITNLNTPDVRKLIVDIINNIQQKQIKSYSYDKFKKNIDKNQVNVNWENFYRNNYNNISKNLEFLVSDIGINTNQQQVLQNIQSALTSLNLQNEIIYIPGKKGFYSLQYPNETGTLGVKISISKLNDLLRDKIKLQVQDQTQPVIDWHLKILKQSDPYKLIFTIIKQLNQSKKTGNKKKDQIIQNYGKPMSKSQVLNKVKSKVSSYFVNPKFRSKVDQYANTQFLQPQVSYLEQFKLDADVNVISKGTDSEKIKMINESDEKIKVQLQKNLKYIPKELQNQLKSIEQQVINDNAVVMTSNNQYISNNLLKSKRVV